jgi:uncharacterized protein YdeI (YjbR/CyaY-like superfamily)
MQHKGLVVKHFKTKADFTDWLKANWQQEESIWLRFAKKDSGKHSPSYEDAREVAICYGWIDGLINKLNDDFYLIKFTKRRTRSLWSKINRDIAETLIKQKKMRKPGLAEVERAKADGRWAAAYDSPKNMTVPKWFETLVAKDKVALKNYQALGKTARYTIASNLRSAKREETKHRRAEKYLAQLRKNEPVL